MDTKQRTTNHRAITESHNGSNNQQRINNNRTTALERTYLEGNGKIKFDLTENKGMMTVIIRISSMSNSNDYTQKTILS